MEFLFAAFLLPLVAIILFLQKFRAHHRNPPPHPPSLPAIGHLHLLKRPLHRNLQNIASTYGPIFTLSFGSRLALIVSSLQIAQECFTKNDIVFADRPRSLLNKHLGYNYTTICAAHYGEHWRNLRRIAAVEIFSTIRQNSSLWIRNEEIRRLLLKLHSESFVKVDLKSIFSELTFKVMMRTVAGKRYYGEEAEAREFREVMAEISAHGGASHWADYVPIGLKWIAGWRFEKSLVRLRIRVDQFLEGLIQEQRNSEDFGKQSTLLDRVLKLQASEPENYSDEIIKGLVLALLFAGTDSSSSTLEWAMTELLNNPKVLTKAIVELDTVVGQDRLFNEPDLTNHNYLRAIVLETLRLHPPAPMLIPHNSSDNCNVAGYDIPHGTMLLINAWAIHRDPKLWANPMRFQPKRFMGSTNECDQSNKLIAFGLGRRACPGANMGINFVGLALGLLIQCYEWKKIGDEKMDMKESGGVTGHKVEPLKALCKARPIMKKVLLNALDQI